MGNAVVMSLDCLADCLDGEALPRVAGLLIRSERS